MKIELMYPDRSRVELFARQEAPGWDVWGNQINSTINLEALAQ